ncbi:uncharacterized protein [Watersipora subatra]|uniref:uncharacterized protein n=1 Tax=Watersipora subatra TaxID=2589382 RepID=UPI00355B2184
MTHKEIQDFITEKLLCFGCLETRHRFKSCPSKAVCKECKLAHATVLHGKHKDKAVSEIKKSDTKPNNPVKSDNTSNSKNTQPSQTTRNKVCNKANHAAPSKQASIPLSWTIPVWVSSKHSDKEVLVYALMDTQSDATFISDLIVDELQPEIHPTKLELTTINETNAAVHCNIVTGLTIRGYNDKHIYDLPTAYTRENIPAQMTHIAKPEMTGSWPHLLQVSKEMPKESNILVGLLISYDFQKMFRQRQIIETGSDSEPYAVRTDLGWSILGNMQPLITHRIMHNTPKLPHDPKIKVVTFKCTTETSKQINRLLAAFSQDFKDFADNEEAASTEDKIFLSIMKKETHILDGYVTMPLPLKEKPPINKSLITAERRFKTLQRKLQKDPNLLKQYHEFMSNLIQNGKAEIIPEEEYNKQDAWYIPHFEVWHPKSQTKSE